MRISAFRSGIILYGIIELILALVLFGMLALFVGEQLPLKHRAIICLAIFLAAFIWSTSVFILADRRYRGGADYQRSNVDISALATLTKEQICKAHGIEKSLLAQENIKMRESVKPERLHLYGTGVIACYKLFWQEREPCYQQLSISVYYIEDEAAAKKRIQSYLGKGYVYTRDKQAYIRHDNGIEAILFDSKKEPNPDFSYDNTELRSLVTMMRLKDVIIELSDMPKVAGLQHPFSNKCIELICRLLTSQSEPI